MKDHALPGFQEDPVSEGGTRLTPGQQKGLDLAVSSDGNLMITGVAGSGKSVLINTIIETYQKMGKNVLTCAPTGVAAMNLDGGKTIHTAFGFKAESCIEDGGPGIGLSLKISRSKLVKLADLIVIDEVSLVPPDLMDSVILSIRKAEEETGRKKKLIVLGDMLQLAPTLPMDSPQRKLLEAYYGESHDNWMAFMGHCWDGCHFQTVMLTEAMRQKDAEFVRCLGLVRKGDPSCLDYLNRAVENILKEGAVFLYPSNQKVKTRNEMSLSSLPGNLCSHKTEFLVEGDACLAQLRKDLLAGVPEELVYKKGAQIIFTATDHAGSCSRPASRSGGGARQADRPNFVNGMGGVIQAVRRDTVTIRTETGVELEVSPMKRTVYEYRIESGHFVKQKAVSYIQYPFILSYALTVHRAQGQTFSNVIVDPQTFAAGQLYVALSRVRSMEGLTLTRPITAQDIRVDKSCLAFHERLEKKHNISHKKGRPALNTDGSTRSELIWVPNALVPLVLEEVELNRLLSLSDLPVPVKGRQHVRVPARLRKGVLDQIESWKKETRRKR